LNKAQKILLKELKEDSRDSELLAGVKKAMVPLGKLRGEPYFKAEITLTVTSIFTNVFGIVAPAAIPAALQTRLPVYLFGLTDNYSGYLAGTRVTPLSAGWFFQPGISGIFGYNNGVVPVFLLPFLQPGDFIFAYDDNTPAGVFWQCFIIIHCNNVGYGTFLNSFSNDLIILNSIRYGCPLANLNQMNNPLHFTTQSLFGKVVTDTIDPRIYITNQQFQQQISDMPITLPIDKSLIMSTNLDFDCQNISFLLAVQKVKPLTLR